MNYTFELKELQATHIVYLHHQGDMSMIPSSIRKLITIRCLLVWN